MQVLLDKRNELDKLTDDLELWFEKYSKGGTPFGKHFEAIEGLKQAFEAAEASEELYRTAGWGLLAFSQVSRQKEKRFLEEVEDTYGDNEAEKHRLTQCYIKFQQTHRVKLQSMQDDRASLKMQSNRCWDAVLVSARSIVKPKGRLQKYMNMLTDQVLGGRGRLWVRLMGTGGCVLVTANGTYGARNCDNPSTLPFLHQHQHQHLHEH